MANEQTRRRYSSIVNKNQGETSQISQTTKDPDVVPTASKIKIAYKIFRAYKKGNKMKPILQSNTTKTVAAAGVVSAGMANGIIIGARAVFGDLPWSADMDNNIAVAATAVLTPLFSWIVAKFRKG